jgi:hypothetical protein
MAVCRIKDAPTYREVPIIDSDDDDDLPRDVDSDTDEYQEIVSDSVFCRARSLTAL